MAASPLPIDDPTPWHEGLAAGRLRLRGCVDCDATFAPSGHACRRCGGERLDWRDSDGRGVVHSVAVVHRAPSDAFRSLVPYTLVLVDLDDGARLMAHGTPGLAIGDRVVARVVDDGGSRRVLFGAG